MLRENATDLLAFLAVARERSFTKAAAKLGVSQSALSHTIRSLEARLGLRLLTRTTRSVSPTEAGEHLLQTIGPRFEEIEVELAALSNLRETPAGKIRISATDHSLNWILRPVLQDFLPQYPDVSVEVCCDYGFVDIAGQGFDAGVRLGEDVAQGMIATRIGPDMRMAVVGEKDGESLKVRVSGQVTLNGVYPLLDAALDGFGLSYIPENVVAPFLADGRLVQVLKDWCPAFSGYHLYYPSRRQAAPAFALLLEALRYRG
jgi:DNA-binding transcriptional LysR family regulator